ncbi:MAG: hypothetical protein WCP59_02580 [Actinomycetota bacterium]
MAVPRLRTVVHLFVGALLGALVVAKAWDASDLGSPSRWWAIPGTVITGALTVMSIPVVAKATPTLVPWLVMCACAATYACVPETDQIPKVALLAAGAFVVHLITSAIGRPVHWVLHVAVAATVLWAGMFGATGRQSALIGALYSWWPFVLLLAMAHRLPPTLGLWRRLDPVARHTTRRAALTWWEVAAVAAIATAAVARTGALEPTVTPAVVAVAIATVASVLLTLPLLPSRRAAVADNVSRR